MYTADRVSPLVTTVTSRALTGLVRIVEGVAFWVAVALPLGYVPVLVRTGEGPIPTTVLAGMLATNLVALVVGHRYKRAGRTASESTADSGESIDRRLGGE